MKKTELVELIKEIFNEISETSTTSGAGGYLSKYAFKKNKNIQEGYTNFKKQVSTRTPRSTARAMTSAVRRKIREIEHILEYSSRLREEIGKDNINIEEIRLLSSKLNELSKKLRILSK